MHRQKFVLSKNYQLSNIQEFIFPKQIKINSKKFEKIINLKSIFVPRNCSKNFKEIQGKFRENLGPYSGKLLQHLEKDVSRNYSLVTTKRLVSDLCRMKEIFSQIKTNGKSYQGTFVEIICYHCISNQIKNH